MEGGENAWLLIKLGDEYAAKEDITLEDKSVISGQDLEEIAATSENIYGKEPKEKAKTVSKKAVKKTLEKQVNPKDGLN
ncbi:hypothetical protein [Dyadobacter flavalbus]|uniref:hypothetical protein n=1 Tax=Dyadobacter flavalbus TaxID=2579942 RepID=UPI001E404BDA|nr:hypothetical protein [Dyadobacter flavalbus]